MKLFSYSFFMVEHRIRMSLHLNLCLAPMCSAISFGSRLPERASQEEGPVDILGDQNVSNSFFLSSDLHIFHYVGSRDWLGLTV